MSLLTQRFQYLVFAGILGITHESLASEDLRCPFSESPESIQLEGFRNAMKPKGWAGERSFQWSHALDQLTEKVGQPVAKSVTVSGQSLDELEAAEQASQCVVSELQPFAASLVSFQRSDRQGQVLNEVVGSVNGTRFPRFRDRTTLKPVDCEGCRLVPLTVTYTAGVDLESLRVSSVIIEMILNPANFTERAYRPVMELQWSIKTAEKSATFVWDRYRERFLDAKNLEAY